MTTPAYSAPTPPAPLDPADTLSKAFATYRDNFGTIFPIALALYVVPSIVALVLDGFIGTLIIGLLSIALGQLFTGITVEVVRDVEDGTLDSSIGDLVRSVTPIILPLFGLSLLIGIPTGIGLALILAPGLFLMTIWAVAIPAFVLERVGVFASFSRSMALVKGNGWQVFGVILAVFALNWVLRIVIVAIFGSLGLFASEVIAWLFAAAVAPIGAIVASVLYLRLRAAHGEAPLPTGRASAKGPLGV